MMGRALCSAIAVRHTALPATSPRQGGVRLTGAVPVPGVAGVSLGTSPPGPARNPGPNTANRRALASASRITAATDSYPGPRGLALAHLRRTLRPLALPPT